MTKPRGRPKKIPPLSPGRLSFVESEMREFKRLRQTLIEKLAPKDGEEEGANLYLHQHVVSYSRHLLDLRNALDQAREEEARRKAEADKANETDPRDITPEEMAARETARAQGLEMDHLQIYVAEFLARTPTVHLVTADGTVLSIFRRTG